MVQTHPRTSKRTKLMKEVAAKYDGRSLVDIIVEGINNNGLSATATELEVSKATLGYWILKMGIQVHRVALKPGQKLQIIEDR